MQDESRVWLEVNARGDTHDPDTAGPRYRTDRRSKLEKCLLLLVAFLMVVLVVGAILVGLKCGRGREEEEGAPPATGLGMEKTSQPISEAEICLTKECVTAAAKINRFLDYNVSFCDDFYSFACGRWVKESVIPPEKSHLDTFGLLTDEVDIVLKNLLEDQDQEPVLDSLRKAKDLYKSCMNLGLIHSRGDQPLRDLLMREFGGWPLVTGNWSEATFDLVETLIKLNVLGFGPIIAFGVGVDVKNSTRNILKIDQPSFGMPGQKYLLVARNDSMLQAYEDLIFRTGQLLQFADQTSARQEVADIVDLEIRLANISVPDENRRDSNALYNPMTLAEIHNNNSKVLDWRRYVSRALSQAPIGLTDVTDDQIIINQSPSYYQSLAEILSNTPKRTVANYMIWRLVRYLMSALSQPYKDILLTYEKVLYGTFSQPARFKTCVSFTTSSFGLAVGRMFIEDHFDRDAKTIAMEMIRELQKSFNQLLDGLDWMDQHTKTVARDKNEFISIKIGYPEQVTNDTYLDLFYTNFTVNKDQYFENAVNFRREKYFQTMRRLREPVDKNLWETPPPVVNAFYSQIKNQIMFPAGILQPPYFSKFYPKSLNYGGIGVVIGHEITHGFDDRGRQYDKNGNLVQWWSQSAVDKFKDKAACIVRQYGNLTVPEANEKLNGINTQGENIADNGGLKQAYKAYRNWVTRRGREEPRLPGLDFNHNQLFFINFAQLWCTLMTEGDAIARIKTGVHSPGRYRVIGSIQNSPDFAEAFKCPVNSPMNPQNKCTVW